jgi:MHS family proline/betaine transporter-like MFS transporter
MGFEVFEAVGFFMVFIFLATYVTRFAGISESAAFTINTLSLGFVLFIIPPAAALSDRIGRKPVMLAAAACAILFAWPLFRLLGTGSFGLTLLGQLGLAAIVGFYEGATPAATAESFPAPVRCTGVAIAFNVTMLIFGGTTPAVATYLSGHFKSGMAPAIYLMVAAVVATCAILTIRETASNALER